MLEQCAVQIDEMQGAAERRAPEADDPKRVGEAWGPQKTSRFLG